MEQDFLQDDQVKSLYPTEGEVGRRGFMRTSLSAGFALATLPIQGTTITTDSTGLIAGEVKIATKDGEIPAYRALPEKKKNCPTVLVVQEIFGVHEHIKDVCRRFAKLGYLAIAPDLYLRQGDTTKIPMAQIMPIVGKVPDAQVMSDLDATAAWALKNGGSNKLAITGFCWGGRITWLYAAHNPKLKAGVAWYGRLTPPPPDRASPLQPKHPIELINDLKAPVLGLYGGKDQGIPVADVDKMKAALLTAKKPSEINLYAEAPHGFHADYRDSYRKTEAQDGWQKLLAWFKKNGVA
jgi:carboxymethylenebutenolidase